MGIFKKISTASEKAEERYERIKKDTTGARRVGGKILDWAIPPPKKKGTGKSPGKSGKTVKIGDCTCTCPPKTKRRR